MNIVENILFQNNHWASGNLKTFDFKRDVFGRVWNDLDIKLISLITGPRRVGKSVVLKQIIKELMIKKNISPRQILFYEFLPNDTKDTIWDVFNYFRKNVANPTSPTYIMFDEIQYVTGYEAMIKNIYDNTEDCKIFVTGSLSLTYKNKMQESLVGRFFSYKLFPLNFLEYIKLYQPQNLNLYENTKIELDSIKRDYLLTQLNAYFRDFLRQGRYPGTFNLDQNQYKLYLNNIISQSLNQDAYSYFKIEKPVIINNLFEYIRQNNGGVISVNKLSSQLGVASQTITQYLNILEQMGLIYSIFNSTNPLIKTKTSRKVYLNSSFGLQETKLDFQTSLGFAVESYILERLLEKDETVTFWKKREKEIDFLLPKKKRGYEIKFRNNPEPLKHNIKGFNIEMVTLNSTNPACLF